MVGSENNILDAGKGKRELILDAAQKVFSEKGFHQATVEEVAELAGVGKGTVYLYFAGKKELLVALLEDRLRAIRVLLEERLGRVSSSKEKLRQVVALHFEFFDRYRDFLSLMLGEVGNLGRELDERTREARLELLDVVKDVLRQGIEKGEFRDVDPEIATYALEGAINLVALEWLIRARLPFTEEHASQLVEICLHGIAKDAT